MPRTGVLSDAHVLSGPHLRPELRGQARAFLDAYHALVDALEIEHPEEALMHALIHVSQEDDDGSHLQIRHLYWIDGDDIIATVPT